MSKKIRNLNKRAVIYTRTMAAAEARLAQLEKERQLLEMEFGKKSHGSPCLQGGRAESKRRKF